MPRTTVGAPRRTGKKQTPAGPPEGTSRRLVAEGENPVAMSASPDQESAPFRWLWYVLSVLMPLAGIVIGLFLYDHSSRAVRLTGRNSLLIGFVVWILMPAALIGLFLVLGAVAAMDWIANVLPPGN